MLALGSRKGCPYIGRNYIFYCGREAWRIYILTLSPTLSFKKREREARRWGVLARGIVAEPPAKPRSGEAGDGADSPTRTK